MMAKKKNKRTLVEQVLDTHNVPYQPLTLNMLTTDAADIPALLATFGLVHPQIFKTLAARGDKTGPLIAVIPITKTLDLKKLASVSGNKKATMLATKELAKTTGYVHGANNPVGIWHHKRFPIYIDLHAQNYDTFVVSAGEVGRSDQLSPTALAELVGAQFAALTAE